jgi:3,4-dihydroxy 2-butanone 4-phosphate synthase/GTP cyclohydrolase II
MISSPEDIIDEARQGRMFILVDDENRENEGDIIIPAECAAPAAIAFMAKQASGLICLALDEAIVERLGLTPVGAGETRFGTAFMTPIGAREGITTGISAADRARTVEAAIADDAGPRNIVTPGHVFPLRARSGGVLARAGHTEAAVDIARLAGLKPAAVLCEIMNEDGTMARLPELIAFARRHGLKIGAIADLIKYRRKEAA